MLPDTCPECERLQTDRRRLLQENARLQRRVSLLEVALTLQESDTLHFADEAYRVIVGQQRQASGA